MTALFLFPKPSEISGFKRKRKYIAIDGDPVYTRLLRETLLRGFYFYPDILPRLRGLQEMMLVKVHIDGVIASFAGFEFDQRRAGL
jgi:hypothetical protein